MEFGPDLWLDLPPLASDDDADLRLRVALLRFLTAVMCELRELPIEAAIRTLDAASDARELAQRVRQ